MRKRLLSTRQISELQKVVLQERLATIPFMRFVSKKNDYYHVEDIFCNAIGRFTEKRSYNIAERPIGNKETLIIVDDI